jgi:uncharacterized protein YgiM (DUF1202 family)
MTFSLKRASRDDSGGLRLLGMLIIAAMLVALLPPRVMVQSTATASLALTERATVQTDRLNLRAEASTSAGVIRTLYRGDVVWIIDGPRSANGYTWYRVDTYAGRGWVAGEFLLMSAKQGDGIAGAPTFAVGERVVTSQRLNFRTEPGTSAGVVRVLATGTLLTLTGGPASANGYVWYQGSTTAATGGDTGWVIGPGLSRAPAGMPDPTVEYDAGSVVRVTTDTLRLRSGAGTSTTILARLSRGTSLTVTGGPVGAEGHTWYPVITSSGTTGWVASAFIAWGGGSAGATAFAPGASVLVNTSRLNVRSAPGTGASVLGQLDAGTRLTVLGGPEVASGYRWYRVQTNVGLSGWVIGEALLAGN